MKQKVNLAASVKARLLNISRERGEDFNLILERYALERLLYRLSQSTHAKQFILKGAMLFALWSDESHRPTRDIDFLKFGDARVEELEKIFREITEIQVEEDGLEFFSDTVQATTIRDDNEYGGIRTTIRAALGNARISVQVDVGFGDVVTPKPEVVYYPTLLDAPAPRLRCYPRETVVAEKYQALVDLGIANSRMKDFYDLYVIANEYDFDGNDLGSAIINTFKQRNTSLPLEPPLALTSEFYEDSQKIKQWDAFIRKGGLNRTNLALQEVCKFLESFLIPITLVCIEESPFNKNWTNKGPWK